MDEDNSLLLHKCDGPSPISQTGMDRIGAHEPSSTEVQSNGRIRRWALIPDVGKYLGVVTEVDGENVHNAFFARRSRP